MENGREESHFLTGCRHITELGTAPGSLRLEVCGNSRPALGNTTRSYCIKKQKRKTRSPFTYGAGL